MREYADEMRAQSLKANNAYEASVRHAPPPNYYAELETLKEEIAKRDEEIAQLQNDIIAMTVPKAPFHAHKVALDTAKKYRLSLHALKGVQRDRYITRARQEAMYEMRHQTDLSYASIGQILGGRDHTTILHGVRQHEKRLKQRADAA